MLTRPGVASVLAGYDTTEHVKEAVAYENATEEEKDYASVLARAPHHAYSGQCTYCGHCAPCPAGIDIAMVNKLYDLAAMQEEVPATVKAHYEGLQPMQKTALHAKAARHDVRSMFRSWKEWKKQKNCLAAYKSGRDKMSDIQLYSIERGTGEPLILLHGNGEESRYFARQIRHFAKTRKVIAIDTRGHGQSLRGNAPFTIRQFAEDLHDFMEEKGIERADILGFSDGGNTALVFALQYPQK